MANGTKRSSSLGGRVEVRVVYRCVAESLGVQRGVPGSDSTVAGGARVAGATVQHGVEAGFFRPAKLV